MVRSDGRLSPAFAGALALAVIVVPVVVRTTEDMLLLVPNPLREAAPRSALPRSLVIRHFLQGGATGIITGILLATARVSGETAPLLFTALSNQFFSLDLTKTMANLPVTINPLRPESLRSTGSSWPGPARC
jgi:phosphate transport system permease protein